MSTIDEFVQLVQSFETYLGDPKQKNAVISFEQCLQADEQEILAWDQFKAVQDWGYFDYFIPSPLGGSFHSLVELYGLSKVLARRDLTLAIAIGLALFGALPIWIAGTEEQKKELVNRLKAGDIGALALTEEDHGSDLVGNEVSASHHTTGWEISGRKWCINFATLGHTIIVFTRTHPKGGVLGFSLFLVDKKLVTRGLSYTPKLPTHGVRGLDISGFELDKVALPETALIGKENHGLEITYKTLQISRALCAGLATGCADAALRWALSFSLDRKLYGQSALMIPVVKQRLGELFTELLILDCASLIMSRAASVAPEYMSLWSAILKFLIPHACEQVVEQCGVILGARGYLRTTEWAMYQKIRRDVQVIGLFDGSSQVNLSIIAGNLLPQVGKRGQLCAEQLAAYSSIFKLHEACPLLAMDKLRLFSQHEDPLLASLALVQSRELSPLIVAIQQAVEQLDKRVMTLNQDKALDTRSVPAFHLAEAYSWLVAGSCCLQVYFYNQASLQDELKDGQWLPLAMQLIMRKISSVLPIEEQTIDVTHVSYETMADHLCQIYHRNEFFSVIQTTLAGSEE